jgi:hypothetical protein
MAFTARRKKGFKPFDDQPAFFFAHRRVVAPERLLR